MHRFYRFWKIIKYEETSICKHLPMKINPFFGLVSTVLKLRGSLIKPKIP